MQSINSNIKQLRESHGLTQEEFARLVNISPGHLSLLENGNRAPSMDLFTRICKEFHITPNKLAGDGAP